MTATETKRKKTQELLQAIINATTVVPPQKDENLLKKAIGVLILRYGSGLRKPNPQNHDKIMLDYVLEHRIYSKEYYSPISAFNGMVGAQSARYAYRIKVLEMIAEKYPILEKECNRRIEEITYSYDYEPIEKAEE